MIHRILVLLSEQLRLRHIEVQADLARENPSVLGNAIQLEQVLLNLLTNARDALEAVSVKQLCIQSVVQGNWVQLSVTDSGPGIRSDMTARLFDPFFTTKEAGKGTGLVPSISYGIIKEHGGQVAVEGTPSKGATFHVRLPLHLAVQQRMEG